MSTTAAPQLQESRLRPQHVRWGLAALGAIALVVVITRVYRHEQLGSPYAVMLIGGAAVGVFFQRTRFCLFCIFKDLFLYRNAKPILMVLGAVAVGSVGYLAIFESWIPDPSQEWLPPQAHIGPVGLHLVAGGLLFGLGMALSGSCISSHLYRLGEGSGLAIPSLAGAAVGFGLGFASWNTIYLRFVEPAPVVWLPQRVGYGGAFGIQALIIGGLAVLALLYHKRKPAARSVDLQSVAAVARRFFREKWGALAGALGIGVIAFLLYFKVEPLGVTAELGRLSRNAFAPVGLVPERLNGLDTLAGCSTADTGEPITTNALFVLALVGGSLLSALAGGYFKLKLPKAGEAIRGFGGGIMLGFGAMISLGCSIGTFLSGSMALSVSGWVFGVFMAVGIWVGLKMLGTRAQTTGCSAPPVEYPETLQAVAPEASDWTNATTYTVTPTALVHDHRYQIVETGRDLIEFEGGHIPGSRFLAWEEIWKKIDGVQGMLPPPVAVARAVARIGLDPERPVAVYDDHGGARAGRLRFALTELGYESVVLVDGGLTSWVLSGFALESGKGGADPGADSGTRSQVFGSLANRIAERWTKVIDVDTLAAALDSYRILDTRTETEFRGEDVRAARAGHIPGSININWQRNIDPQTRMLRSREALHELYADVLADDRPIVVSCQSGRRSCQTMLVLSMLGRSDVYLYDGSWTEWGNRTDLPVDGPG